MVKDFREFYKLYEDARDFDRTRFDDYAELMAFYEGRQHLLSSYAGDKPWVIDINTPYASDAINTRVASLLSNDYVGEIFPLSPYDVDAVEKLNSAYHNMWNEMNMDNIVNQSILRSAIIREAYIHVIYNDDIIYGGTNTQRKGKLEAYFIEPAAILIDPNALTFKEADYVIIVERVSAKYSTQRYSKFDPKNIRQSFYSRYERGEIYYGNEYGDEDEIFTKATFYEVENRGMPNQVIYKTVFIEDQLVYKTKELPIKHLPIAQLRWEKKMKSPYGISLMDRLLPLQKSVNSIESAITNTALAFAAPSFVLSKDSGLDPMDVARTAGAPGMVYPVEGNIDLAIRPLMQGKVVDQELLQIKQEHQNTIYQIAGITPQFIGELGTSGNTSGGSSQAIARAKVIENNFMENLEEYVEDLTHIIVEFIVKVFAGEKLYTRTEKKSNGQFNFDQLEVPAVMDDFDYEFHVNLDIRTPFNKQNVKELMLQLYQFERQYDAPVKVVSVLDILKTYDVPNRDELLDRYKQMMTQSNDKKAEIITELSRVSMQYGIQPAMLQQAISELLEGRETPTLDILMQQVQQIKDQIAQQQQAEEDAMIQETKQAAQDPMVVQQMMQQMAQGSAQMPM